MSERFPLEHIHCRHGGWQRFALCHAISAECMKEFDSIEVQAFVHPNHFVSAEFDSSAFAQIHNNAFAGEGRGIEELQIDRLLAEYVVQLRDFSPIREPSNHAQEFFPGFNAANFDFLLQDAFEHVQWRANVTVYPRPESARREKVRQCTELLF
ncbi:MAG: hypothetical protein GY768_14280 [Planctomycetaceae bacterium]|nr:hypothetical protein [Planctomycetaceae bacterium]